MTDAQTDTPLYLDTTRPVEERARDLISRMTLEEKVSQMRNSAEAIDRLGIPAYDYWNEGLHGVGRNGRATVFPQAIGMAATWDTDLIYRVATAISTEGRAKYHETLRRCGNTIIYQGLTFWSPNVNIFRDPRWGRGQETWGEDPFLTGEMGAAFVHGMQGDDPHYLRTAACAKHYAVHSGPEDERHTFDANVTRRELFDTYLPAFKKLVTEANVEIVMGAYNRLYGIPCCASPLLIQEILRDKWGFKGHFVSDCGALADFHQTHGYTKDVVESAGVALKAGCDLSCVCTYEHLPEAIERGLITEKDIDESLIRTYTTRFKLGMFDPVEKVPYAAIPMDVVGCEEHRQLAYEAAVKSMVLLKNRNNILPLKKETRDIYVVGPNAANLDCLLGSYFGINDHMVTALEGLSLRAPEGTKVEYKMGSLLAQQSANPFDWSLEAAPAADVTIACMGLAPVLEGEEGDALLSAKSGDRESLSLPAPQVDYIKKLVVRGARIVLVIFSGSPVVLGELEDMVEAIIQVWYPGEEGGKALADVLFGNATPSGKLPITFPASLSQLPAFNDYSMNNRTYRYSKETPAFPFGFGLSYTKFTYNQLILHETNVKMGQPLELKFNITNAGDVEAEEVAQIYLTDVKASTIVPQYKLIGFKRIHLQPGETRTVPFTVTPEMMMFINDNGDPILEPGDFVVHVGGSSPSQRAVDLGLQANLTASFNLS
ncbi:glycoside hydrolase family 3 C-terminal domain-containing protein [Leptolinea tardivitalis]|uniref:Beta-glucosidase n=1 Tax=Leptolinea tardivitalis TaxID=229920 RepID=A0A0P6X8D2_9CHLR|nr:glycoside hydrolase family 3 C-terminal domain-containing protein [Leptolinea tardivitalis]KPL70483.1 beta-glucosidase [Leptolinea tardivitalis]GAP22073.1 beta-glucosidase-related glycosidase [Leptolinea tardivitalis]